MAMTLKHILRPLAVSLLTVWAAPAFGQMHCKDRALLVKELGQRYHEKVIGRGVTDNGYLIEVLARDDGDTWTIISTKPRGESCVLTTGKFWRQLKPEEPDT